MQQAAAPGAVSRDCSRRNWRRGSRTRLPGSSSHAALVRPSIAPSSRSKASPIWTQPGNGRGASCRGTTTSIGTAASATSPGRSAMPARMAACSAARHALYRAARERKPGAGAGRPATGRRWPSCPSIQSATLSSTQFCPNPAFQFARRACCPVPAWCNHSHGETQGLGLQRRPRELSHARCSEHGEDGENRTFPAVNTVARSSPVGVLFLGYCPLAIRVVWINQRSLRNPGSDLLDTHRVAVLSDPQSDWAVSYLLTLVSGLADVRTQESISKVIDRLHSEAP